MTLTSFTSFIATVPNNAFQILLNPPRRVFSNTFQQVSDHPKVVKMISADIKTDLKQQEIK